MRRGTGSGYVLSLPTAFFFAFGLLVVALCGWSADPSVPIMRTMASNSEATLGR
jgi:hypothetical protein